MAIVFLSHSSSDNDVAAQIKQGLLDNGYEAVFLDVDKHVGIRAGSHWRDELARQLRTADAVVYLGSSQSQHSVWCTAELAVAQTLEKLILPLQLERGAHHELLDDHQWVRLSTTAEDAFTRLLDELEHASETSAHRRSWDPRRSPFPGLRPFTEADAGVFFGRDAALEELMRMVDPVTLLDHRGLVVVVGASGAGKSSLVRAGLIPALRAPRRHDAVWFVLPPVIPGRDFKHELVRSLRAAGAEARLVDAVAQGDAGLADVIDAMAAAQRPPADRGLVVVDQAEELCNQPERIGVLKSLIESADAGARCRIVLTVREGYVSRLFNGLDVDGHVLTFALAPLSRAALALVIEEPAKRADLTIEAGFVQSVLDDAQTGEALPLLALALERTYRSMLKDDTRRLGQERYQAVGGVGNAVAQQASEALAHLGPDGEARAVEFLARLVTIDDEGQWARRPQPVNVGDDPDVLAALEEARLVVVEDQDGKVVGTVAHSALFSAWPPLARALEARSDDIRFRSRLERDASEWDDSTRPTDRLPVGRRYQEIARWRRKEPTGDLSPVLKEYLHAASRLERRRRRRRSALAFGVASLLVVAVILGLGQLRARARADAITRLANARGLMSRALVEPRFDLAFQLGLRALSEERSPETLQGLIGVAAREPAFRGYIGPAMPSAGRALWWNADNDILVGDAAGGVTRWSSRRTELARYSERGPLVRSVVEAPDKAWVAWADTDGHVTVHLSDETKELSENGAPAHQGTVAELVLVDDRRLVSVGNDGQVELWDVLDGAKRWTSRVHAPVTAATLVDPAGQVVVGTADGEVVSLSLTDGAVLGRVKASDVTIRSLATLGLDVVSGDDGGAVRLLQPSDRGGRVTGTEPLYTGPGVVRAITPLDDSSILTGWTDGVIRLIDANGRVADTFIAHGGSIRDLAFDPRTRWFAATSDDGLVSRWDLSGRSPLVHHQLETTSDLVGDIDINGQIYIGGTDQQVSIVAPDTPPRPLSGRLPDYVVDVDASDDGSLVGVGLRDGSALVLSTADGQVLAQVDVGDTRALVALSGELLVAAGDEVRTIDVRDGTQTAISLPANVEVESLAATDGGRLIVIGGKGGEGGAALVLVRDGRVMSSEYFGTPGLAVNDLDIDADDDTIAVGRSDGRIDIWNLDPFAESGVYFARHSDEIYDVRFVPDSSTVLSIDGAGLLWTWNAQFGTSAAAPIDSGLERARSVLPDPDGDDAMIIGYRGITSVILDPGRLERIACELAYQGCD